MKALMKGLGIGLALGMILIFAWSFYHSHMLNKPAPEQTPVPAETADTEVSAENSSEDTVPLEDSSSAETTDTEDAEEVPPEPEPAADPVPSEAVLAFAGDVMFSEQYIASYDQNGISAFADPEMLKAMQDADLFMFNEEFPFSLRGEAMEDKQYTFRTDPKYISIFQELGVDLVTVANNHALDFGQDAFCDTLDTLKQAGIPYVGGGYNFAEASAPAIFTLQGQTFAVFAATRVSPSYDWYATDSQAGLFQTYDPTRLNAAIAEADQQYDHVIVFVHWGIERNELPEDYQRSLARGYIDAGADLIVGCHPHVLQGFEYYQGVPVAYSLGNYLFGNRTGETLLLKAHFSDDGALTVRLLPCRRENGILTSMKDPGELYRHLTELSFEASVSENGILTSAGTSVND